MTEDEILKLVKIIDTGMVYQQKTVTHGNPDLAVGGLVTVDYVHVSFRQSDWDFVKRKIGDIVWRMMKGPHDRGTADFWYNRPFDPHYFVGGSFQSDRVDLPKMNPEEITAYTVGYRKAEADGSQKDWG